MKKLSKLEKIRRRNILISISVAIIAIVGICVYFIPETEETPAVESILIEAPDSVTLTLGVDTQITYSVSIEDVACVIQESDKNIFIATAQSGDDYTLILSAVSVGTAYLTITTICSTSSATAVVEVIVVDSSSTAGGELGEDATDLDKLTYLANEDKKYEVISVTTTSGSVSDSISLTSAETNLSVVCSNLSAYLIDEDENATTLEVLSVGGDSKIVTLHSSYAKDYDYLLLISTKANDVSYRLIAFEKV